MAAGTSAILSVRVSAAEKSALTAAADQAKSSISEFVRRSAVQAAEEALMERSDIVISADQWEKIEALVSEPAEPTEGMAELITRKPVWQA